MLGETGTGNDGKINEYGQRSETFLLNDLLNVRGITNPPTVVSGVLTQAELNMIKNICDLLAVAYFYKFESGDTLTAEASELSWKTFFENKFRRPRFRATTGL